MATNKIGIITIGQSPRKDVMPDMLTILGQDYEILEVGALDDTSMEEIKRLKKEADDQILVTRMRDGTEVKITHGFIEPLIQKRIEELDRKRVGVILILCTGKFPEFNSKTLIVMPSEIVQGAVYAGIRKGRLGVVYPAKEQTVKAKEEWGREGLEVYADWASPYGPKREIDELAERLGKKDLNLILLNCMGFGHEMKRIVQERTEKPVIQANALVARVLKEYTP